MERSPEQIVHDLKACGSISNYAHNVTAGHDHLYCTLAQCSSHTMSESLMCSRLLMKDAADCIELLLEIRKNQPVTKDDYAGFLCMIGIPTVVTGFSQLVEALWLLDSDKSYRNHFMNRLYPDVGKATQSTGRKAERNMRYAISARWYEFADEVRLLYSKTGNPYSIPTLSEFLYTTIELAKEGKV